MRTAIIWAAVAVTGLAADWPQFRGPGADGQAAGPAPAAWAPDKNVVWKSDVPGFAWSSPVVVGDSVFVTAADADGLKVPTAPDFNPLVMMTAGKPPDQIYRWSVVCLDRASGSRKWSRVVAERKPPIAKHPTNTFATETPAADGERVYAVFASIGLVVAFDRTGAEVWRRDIGVHKTGVGFGTGSSPLLAEGRLFVQWDNEEKSALYALDPATGRDVWVVQRPTKTSWASPYLWRTASRNELITCGEGRVTSYDPASGKVLWELGGIGNAFTASPVADRDRLYFGNSGPGSPGPLLAVKAGASGDLTGKTKTSDQFAWSRLKAGPGMPSPVLLEGKLYIASQGTLSCYDAATGEPVYVKERLPRARGITATPLVAGGKLYLLDETGRFFEVTPGPSLNAREVAKLEDGLFWSTPALVDGRLFVRGANHVFCIEPERPAP
jgi:outer membrane protein assembly factor BamB